jgi:uncharacterized cupin superfamily protein
VRRANVLQVEVDDALDLHGFHHSRMDLTERVGGHSIGASVYVTGVGGSTGPYHYHHGVEEWMYVVSGEPSLRDHEGERHLQPGDLVCFPSGPSGAHQPGGPGTYVVFSTGTHREPWMSVYPDSGKVSGPEGVLLASSAVDYWHGEGNWEPPGESVEQRERRAFPRRPIVNLSTLVATEPPPRVPAPPGFAARRAPLGPALGAEMLGATVYELDPGEGTAPYHYHSGREEWLLILTGEPTVRHPDGEDQLAAGDVVCFPDGASGAHRVLNRGSEQARLLLLSTMTLPVTAHYPDSGKILIREADGASHIFRHTDAVDYWEGEADPDQTRA